MINRIIRTKAHCFAFSECTIVTFFNFDELKYLDRSFIPSVNIPLSYLQIFDDNNYYWLKTDLITSCIHFTASSRINALLKDCVTVVLFFFASSSKPKDTTANSITMGNGWV